MEWLAEVKRDISVTFIQLGATGERQVAAAKTINIAPTAFPPNVAPTLSNEQRALVANVLNRAWCVSLATSSSKADARQLPLGGHGPPCSRSFQGMLEE
jgi:hypothetical protein